MRWKEKPSPLCRWWTSYRTTWQDATSLYLLFMHRDSGQPGLRTATAALPGGSCSFRTSAMRSNTRPGHNMVTQMPSPAATQAGLDFSIQWAQCWGGVLWLACCVLDYRSSKLYASGAEWTETAPQCINRAGACSLPPMFWTAGKHAARGGPAQLAWMLPANYSPSTEKVYKNSEKKRALTRLYILYPAVI